MKRPTDDDLVLRYYDEPDAPTEQGIRDDPTAAKAYRELESILDQADDFEVPDPGPDFEERMLARLRARAEAAPVLPMRRRRSLPRLALLGSLAAMLLLAFLVGRWSRSGEPVPVEVRERVLVVAVGGHLEETRRLLVEVAHRRGGDDLEAERRRADSLVVANRLYRNSLTDDPEAPLTRLLEDVESTLLEIANAPDRVSAADLASLQRLIAKRGLLVRIEILGDTALPAPAPRGSSGDRV